MNTFDAWRDEQVAAFQAALDGATDAYSTARELTNDAFWIYQGAASKDEARIAREVWIKRRVYECTVLRFYEAARDALQAAQELSAKAKKNREIEGDK